ncbi:MAG: DUF4270 domain-containing protein [Paludibacteraceae bacterium]|nr:DUF4270 domain-containing protein [Paludibacteraceae bacterium]
MRLYKLPLYAMCLTGILMSSCEDDNAVGLSIQPEEDLLSVYHNHINLKTQSSISDSVLSKADYLLFGRYSDNLFGEIQAEYMTQLDARAGGIILPDTTVVSYSSATTGILNTILEDLDSKFGEIKKVSKARNFTIDSTIYLMQYSSGFWGDSTALQSVQVYELNKEMDQTKYYTNVSIQEYCDESLLLGETNYQIQNSREIRVPISNEFGERISSYYREGKVSSQKEFNEYFKGVYVKHAFNEGTVLKVDVSGILIYYHYDADIQTTINGKDTTITSEKILKEYGTNPLVTSYFLSGNKSVKRANAVQHEDWENAVKEIQKKDSIQTYIYTPVGMYTEVEVPIEAIMDSVKKNVSDTNKVMFNSIRLVFHRKEIENKYLYSGQLLLIEKDSMENFFYNNKSPDGLSSFTSSIDSKTDVYAFNITRPTQNKISQSGKTYSIKMALVPVERTLAGDNYSYKQQLWMTSTALYGSAAPDSLKPCVDIIYTKRN